jgi:hypothetical protein
MARDIASIDLLLDQRIDLLGQPLLLGRRLADDRRGGCLVPGQPLIGPLLGGERRGRPLLELLELGLGVLEGQQARVERSLLGGRLLAQVVGPGPGVLGRLVERSEGLLVDGDLVGQRLVLLADIDEVAHLGQQVGERSARQERLEERGPVGVVRAPHAF